MIYNGPSMKMTQNTHGWKKIIELLCARLDFFLVYSSLTPYVTNTDINMQF